MTIINRNTSLQNQNEQMSPNNNQQLEQMNNEVNMLQSTLRSYFKSNDRAPI